MYTFLIPRSSKLGIRLINISAFQFEGQEAEMHPELLSEFQRETQIFEAHHDTSWLYLDLGRW